MDTLWDSISLRVGFDFITNNKGLSFFMPLSLSYFYASSSSESSSESSSPSVACNAAAASKASHSSKV